MKMQQFFRFYSKLFGRPIFSKFNKFLYYCAIRGLGIYNYESMDISGEEYFIKNILKKYSVQKDKFVVFDVGANIGNFIKIVLNNLENAYIFAFEPHPKTFELLKFNTQGIDNIKLFNCALSSRKGKLKLYDYASKDYSSHASFYSEIFPSLYNTQEINSYIVDVTTIDLVCMENNIEIIDFLKIDVEGHEREVLEGAKQMLENNRIRCIQFEFTQINIYTRVFFKDFWDILSDKYRIYRLLPRGMLEINKYNPTFHEIFGYQNLVAILKEA